MLGGILMGLVGVLYLFFEKSILPPEGADSLAGHTLRGPSKFIIGAQTGLIFLAMVVTRSSIGSLQGKRGLPLGNQVVGWIVLGKADEVFF